MKEAYGQIQFLNSDILAISMDDGYDTTILATELNLPYRVLSDPEANVIKKYGIFNLLEDSLATPSVFIIDSNKTIVWSYIGETIKDRAQVADILSNIPSE